jgi:hypothetical protein
MHLQKSGEEGYRPAVPEPSASVLAPFTVQPKDLGERMYPPKSCFKGSAEPPTLDVSTSVLFRGTIALYMELSINV